MTLEALACLLAVALLVLVALSAAVVGAVAQESSPRPVLVTAVPAAASDPLRVVWA